MNKPKSSKTSKTTMAMVGLAAGVIGAGLGFFLTK